MLWLSGSSAVRAAGQTADARAKKFCAINPGYTHPCCKSVCDAVIVIAAFAGQVAQLVPVAEWAEDGRQ